MKARVYRQDKLDGLVGRVKYRVYLNGGKGLHEENTLEAAIAFRDAEAPDSRVFEVTLIEVENEWYDAVHDEKVTEYTLGEQVNFDPVG